MTTSVSRRLNILSKMNVQDYSVLYNNAVRSVLCEGWHFTHMWKAQASPHHFAKRGNLGLSN
jgi:hypothetical protein